MSHAQLEAAGALGREDLAKLFPEQVITVSDERHFLHGKIPALAARYDLADPEMQGLIASMKVVGVLQPGEAWHFKESGLPPMVVFGARRTEGLWHANQQRQEEGQDPFPMPYKIVTRRVVTAESINEALDRYADENNQRKANDWLTIAVTARRQLDLGVDENLILDRWPMITGWRQLRDLTRSDGILSAIEELQEALAKGAIRLPAALKLAKLKLSEQKAALQAVLNPNKSAPKAESRKYITPQSRQRLKELIDQLAAGTQIDMAELQKLGTAL